MEYAITSVIYKNIVFTNLVKSLSNLLTMPKVKIELWGPHLFALHVNNQLDSFIQHISSVSTYENFTDKSYLEINKTFDILENYDFPGNIPIRVFAGNKSSHLMNRDEKDVIISNIKDIAYKAFERGFVISVETHQGTICDTIDSTLYFLSKFNTTDNVKLLLDIYNLSYEKTLNFEKITKLLSYANNIHIKNSRSFPLVRTNVPTSENIKFQNSDLNDGVLNWKQHFALFKKNNFDGVITLEQFSFLDFVKTQEQLKQMVSLYETSI